ncbi:hypothetical protein CUMW_034530 [Citrus unshiu]|nr:hypothetical protein CUMW_034530 [Citrus unshiu]
MQWLNGSVRFSHSVRFIRLLSDSNSRTKLFIGGLSYDTNETVLKDAFGQHGEIIEVKVICDRVTGQSRGYGFVKFASEAAAGEAIKEMDGLKHSSELCAQGLILGLRCKHIVKLFGQWLLGFCWVGWVSVLLTSCFTIFEPILISTGSAVQQQLAHQHRQPKGFIFQQRSAVLQQLAHQHPQPK